MASGPNCKSATLFLNCVEIRGRTERERTDNTFRHTVCRRVVTVKMSARLAPLSVWIREIDVGSRTAPCIQSFLANELLTHRKDPVSVYCATDNIFTTDRHCTIPLTDPRFWIVSILVKGLPKPIKRSVNYFWLHSTPHNQIAVFFKECFIFRC